MLLDRNTCAALHSDIASSLLQQGFKARRYKSSVRDLLQYSSFYLQSCQWAITFICPQPFAIEGGHCTESQNRTSGSTVDKAFSWGRMALEQLFLQNRVCMHLQCNARHDVRVWWRTHTRNWQLGIFHWTIPRYIIYPCQRGVDGSRFHILWTFLSWYLLHVDMPMLSKRDRQTYIKEDRAFFIRKTDRKRRGWESDCWMTLLNIRTTEDWNHFPLLPPILTPWTCPCGHTGKPQHSFTKTVDF